MSSNGKRLLTRQPDAMGANEKIWLMEMEARSGQQLTVSVQGVGLGQ